MLRDLISPTALGAIVTPTVTISERIGSTGSRTAETPAGLLYNTGLPNPGMTRFLDEVLPLLAQYGAPIIVSLAASNPQDWSALAAALEDSPDVAALEANLCGLPQANGSTDSPTLQEYLVTAVRSIRRACSKSLLVKLPPDHFNTADLCRKAELEGADAIVTGQSLRAASMRWSGDQPSLRFGEEGGRYSGPAIKPISLLQAQLAAGASTLPIIAGGGIMTPQDAIDFFAAGADVIAVGTLCLVSPNAINTLNDEVAAILQKIPGDDFRALCLTKRPRAAG